MGEKERMEEKEKVGKNVDKLKGRRKGILEKARRRQSTGGWTGEKGGSG
jgi:hypothetical protein